MNFLQGLGDFLGQILGYVLWFFFDLFDNFVPAIVILTVVLRCISFPFELKSRKAMAKNAKISIKTREIQKKFANNKQKMNEEMAKLYEKEGVNPMGGCFPQLFPTLVFLGMYGAIVRPITNLFHVSNEVLNSAINAISTIPGISNAYNSQYIQLEVIKIFPKISEHLTMFTPEQASDIMDFNKGFNFFGLDLFAIPMSSSFESLAWIWPVLAAITMVLNIFISQRKNPEVQNSAPGCMKFLPYMMSLIFVGVVLYAPAALGVYYTLNNILMLIQSQIISKFFSQESMLVREEAARIARLEIDEAKVLRVNSPKKISVDDSSRSRKKKK